MERPGFIAKSEKNLRRLEALRSALLSKPYMFALLLLACIITVTGTEFYGILVFVCIVAFNLIVCDELISTTLPFMLASAIMIKCFDSFATYIKLAPVAPFVKIIPSELIGQPVVVFMSTPAIIETCIPYSSMHF